MSTPHARGSTALGFHQDRQKRVYPACAGIHPKRPYQPRLPGRLPRMRGDPPDALQAQNDPQPIPATFARASTPHARGSTYLEKLQSGEETVYPACAGIHLSALTIAAAKWRLPRMRGDPPDSDKPGIIEEASTPHARGSTSWQDHVHPRTEVYPACAGIHPNHPLVDH